MLLFCMRWSSPSCKRGSLQNRDKDGRVVLGSAERVSEVRVVEHVLSAILHLVRGGSTSRLVLLTYGALQGSCIAAAAHGGVWGLGRVVRQT